MSKFVLTISDSCKQPSPKEAETYLTRTSRTRIRLWSKENAETSVLIGSQGSVLCWFCCVHMCTWSLNSKTLVKSNGVLILVNNNNKVSPCRIVREGKDIRKLNKASSVVSIWPSQSRLLGVSVM